MRLHAVVVDHDSGYERYTCPTNELHNECTLVRQPWTSDIDWKRLIEGFITRHPCSFVKTKSSKSFLPATGGGDVDRA